MFPAKCERVNCGKQSNVLRVREDGVWTYWCYEHDPKWGVAHPTPGDTEAAYWRGKYEGLSQGVEAMLMLGGAFEVREAPQDEQPEGPIFDRDEEPEDGWPFLGTPPDPGAV